MSIATLGRGGSDTTAVALGAWLNAEYVDIFTDVPGVAMTDPRIVPQAPYIPYLDYLSMFRLSLHGSKVLHDLSAKIAMEKKVRVRIRSTFDDTPGTVIGPQDNNDADTALVGITVKGKDDNTSLITIVYKAGAGTAGSEKAFAHLGVKALPSDDPDVILFDSPKTRVKETLYVILDPYINKKG